MKLTLVITKGSEYFIGRIKEIPNVLTQGISIEDVKENTVDALGLYLDDLRSEKLTSEVVYEDDLIFA
jgi:predicted RNase H-like HicB family nuclease